MAKAKQGTSLQGKRASYYSSPSQGRVVTTQGGYQYGRDQGGTYRARTPSGQMVSGRVPSRTWHRVVLAEFIGTILVIAIAPLVVPQKSEADDAGIVAVSFAGPLVRLTAVCVLFFVLALMATGEKSGKVAAAFGALVLVGSALNAGDMWGALVKAFAGSGSTTQPAANEGTIGPARGADVTTQTSSLSITPGGS